MSCLRVILSEAEDLRRRQAGRSFVVFATQDDTAMILSAAAAERTDENMWTENASNRSLLETAESGGNHQPFSARRLTTFSERD